MLCCCEDGGDDCRVCVPTPFYFFILLTILNVLKEKLLIVNTSVCVKLKKQDQELYLK